MLLDTAGGNDMAKEPSEQDDKDRPGPADHGREGGMATRENAPELTENDD
ncbi:hypothetical protein [Mycolicibacterium chubuense]|uniref:Uncharacterized protein n=1 Tax=Mycolicibacterium chubuense TaxID=1800 RepID=A0A0J6VSR5_MYCCU|nr:hypothetical protein [Mycolicibacterium chubuense]KMO72533.1 hypothetical protein MCHUDSM44219_04826 [Mycolicibacterium chubuense]SPX99235.1 Uncharacterised protein [Mycolicibacterium chubuense]